MQTVDFSVYAAAGKQTSAREARVALLWSILQQELALAPILLALSSVPSLTLYPLISVLEYGLVVRVVCVLQFCLGALLWVRGQAIGSLACN